MIYLLRALCAAYIFVRSCNEKLATKNQLLEHWTLLNVFRILKMNSHSIILNFVSLNRELAATSKFYRFVVS